MNNRSKNNLASFVTDRLLLVPAELELCEALLNKDFSIMEKLGYRTNEQWPREDTMDILPLIKLEIEKNYGPTGYELWMIVRKEDMLVIGDIGFKGNPDEEGSVEIGYGIIESEHGKGYGFEALKAMVDWAFQQEEVNAVKADCLLDNKGSARILEKTGLKEVKRDKELIYWEIKKVKLFFND